MMASALDRPVVFVEVEGFALAVELKGRPELIGTPVVVGSSADPGKRGAVVEEASIEARALGVSVGMSLSKAFGAVPDLVIIEVDYAARESATDAFLTLLGEYTPLVESYSPGAAFMALEPAPKRSALDDAVEVAREVAGSVRNRLGLPAVAGVGENKFTAMAARLATGEKGPVAVIPPVAAPRILSAYPVGKVPGVDRAMKERLEKLGGRTLGDVAAMQERHLTSNFGRYLGNLLRDRARGGDSNPVVPFNEPDGVAREVVLDEPTGDISELGGIVYALSEEVAAMLKAARTKCTGVTIKAGQADLRTVVVAETFEEPTDSMNDIWGAAKGLVSGLDIRGPVRSVGVMAVGTDGRA